MKANNTPIASRLVASVSLAAALSGALLTFSAAAAPAASSSASSAVRVTAAATPDMRCGSDCPWDGTNS